MGPAVKPDQLSGIMADYLALERTKTLGRLLTKRFGVLAAIFAGISFLSAVRFRLVVQRRALRGGARMGVDCRTGL